MYARLKIRGLAAVLGLALAAHAAAQVPDPVRLGLLVSLTGSNAAYGAAALAGTRLAIDEIGKAGGIDGKRVQLVTGDDQTDPARAVSEALRLTAEEKVAVVIGPLTSQMILAVGPTFNQAKVLDLTAGGSTAMTPQRLKYQFSVAAPADVEATMMVDYAVDTLKARSIAWLGDNGPIDKDMLTAVKAEAQKRNAKVVAAQEYPYRGDDVTPQILSLRNAKPDVLLMRPNTGEDHGLIMRTIHEVNWKVPIVNGGGSVAATAPAVKVYPDAYRGLVNATYRSWTYCPADPVGETPLGRFKTRLRAFVGAGDYDRLNQSAAAQYYDAVYLAKAAIEATHTVDAPTLTKWIEQNAGSVRILADGPIEASASSHFLLGSPRAMTFAVNPDQPRADGLIRRASCP